MSPRPALVGRIGMLAIAAGVLLGTNAIPLAGASSHREAPTISNDPAADNTDMYVFRSPDAPDTVTAIMNVWPFEQPEGGPNWYLFDPSVRYSMHLTNDGRNQEAMRLDFQFRTDIRAPSALGATGPIKSLDDPNFNVRQFYSVDLVKDGQTTHLGDNLPVPPANIGPKTTPNYDALANAAIVNIPSIPGGKVFAGPRDDPFFIDVGSLFDTLTIRPGAPGNVGGGVDQLAGMNVLTVAVQLPISAVVRPACNMSDPKDMNCVVGLWETTSRQTMRVLNGEQPATTQGDYVQVSRLSAPLVNELIVPSGMKDAFNASDPKDDARFLPLVQDPEPARLLKALYNLDIPPAPRQDIVTIFLMGIPGLNQPPNVQPAEIAHLNLAVPVTAQPNRMGVLGGDMQGFPNGRRLGDDVVDIELQALAGGTPFTADFNKAPNNQLGDGVDQNDKPFLSTFPYVASPHQGFDHTHHRLEPARAAGAPAPAAAAPAPAAVQPVTQPRTGNSGLAAVQLVYTAQEGDTLQSISAAVYGSADHTDEILANNLDVLAVADDLQPGMVLALPASARAALTGR